MSYTGKAEAALSQSADLRVLALDMAKAADREAEKNRLVCTDPVRAASLVCSNGILPGELARALYVLAGSILPSDIIDWQPIVGAIEHAADVAYDIQKAMDRRDADLDAPAAARSDEAYDRKIDAGLIGRSEFLPPLETTP